MNFHRVSLLVPACFAVWAAQDLAAQDKVTVPLSSPSQPATVKVHLMHGSITITGGATGQVIVESAASPDRREARGARDVPAGMHRIDTGRAGLDVEEDHNVVNISGGRAVPAPTSPFRCRAMLR